MQRAEARRDVFEELSGLSARKAAEELNARGIPTPDDGKWCATQVIRVHLVVLRLSLAAEIARLRAK
jgi:Recombinase